MTREEAIDMCMEVRHYLTSGNPIWDKDKVGEAIEMAIEALQTDIVRCKDCRHAYYADNRVPHERTWVCERFMNEEINANDFCSWGERSEE